MMRNLGLFAVALAAAVPTIPTAHASPIDDYITTVAQHHVRIKDNRDRVEAVYLGQSVCDHLREGSNPLAEREKLRGNDARVEQAQWIVTSAQVNLCPDTIQPESQ
jgi:hypothetical protein